MDDLSLFIAGDEPDLIIITEILPKRSITVILYLPLDYQSMVTKHFSTSILILTSLLKQYVVLGYMFQTSYLYLKLLFMDTHTMKIFGFEES